MSRGGAEHAEKIVRKEHCNWSSAVTAAPRDQVFQLSNFFRATLGNYFGFRLDLDDPESVVVVVHVREVVLRIDDDAPRHR